MCVSLLPISSCVSLLPVSPSQSSILKDVVQEACQFVCYAQEDLRSKVKTLPEALVQLQKQVQRVALSVVLTSKTSDRNAAKVNETCDMPSEEVTCSEQTSSEPKLSLASSLKGLTGRQTVPSQTPSFLTSTTVPTATGDLLQLISQEDAQFRLHRLSVLLELAEPGTLPQPDLLASLLDFVSGSTHCTSGGVILHTHMYLYMYFRQVSMYTIYIVGILYVDIL